MSRNSKNARRHAEARERSKNRKNGSKGPKINSSKPGVKTYRTDENGKPRAAGGDRTHDRLTY